MKSKNIILVIFLFLLLTNSISFIFVNIESFEKEIPEKLKNSSTTILRPNGDTLTEWDGDPTPHWSRINEIESAPDGIYVRWIDGDENQSEVFDMEDFDIENNIVKEIQVHIFGFRYWTGPAFVSLYLGTWTEEREVKITIEVVDVDEWISCSWKGLKGTNLDLLNLQVKIDAGEWCSADGYCRIDTLYCVVIYGKPSETEAIPGYNLFLVMSVIFIISVVIIDNRYRSLKNK